MTPDSDDWGVLITGSVPSISLFVFMCTHGSFSACDTRCQRSGFRTNDEQVGTASGVLCCLQKEQQTVSLCQDVGTGFFWQDDEIRECVSPGISSAG